MIFTAKERVKLEEMARRPSVLLSEEVHIRDIQHAVEAVRQIFYRMRSDAKSAGDDAEGKRTKRRFKDWEDGLDLLIKVERS